MSKSAYMDTIVKDIFKQQNEFKQIIYRNNDNCIYPKLNNLNSLLKELNEKIKPKNLKCFIRNVSRKELSNVKPMKEFLKLEILNKEPNIELLILEPAFICRKCIPSKIFDSEDELRTHQGEGGHRFEAKRVKNLSLGVLGKSLLASMPIQQVNQPVKELTIIKNNTTCVAVPLFELFDKSGALAEINNRIKSINLKCHIVKETG